MKVLSLMIKTESYLLEPIEDFLTLTGFDPITETL